MKKTLSKIDPLLLDFPQAAAALNISISFLHSLDNSGRIVPPKKLGNRRLFSVRELESWIASNCPSRTALAMMKDEKK